MLKPDSRAARAMQHRYYPKQRSFIEAVKELVKAGAVYHSPKTRLASSVVAVTEPDTEKLRFTADLRAPYKKTLPAVSVMPDLKQLIQSTGGSSVYAKLDMCHAYWQIPLHKDSQDFCLFKPRYALSPQIDFVKVREMLETISRVSLLPYFHKKNWKAGAVAGRFSSSLWQRDRTSQKHWAVFPAMCRVWSKAPCQKKKCELCTNEANFCGRVISSKGVGYCPREMDLLLNMRKPEFAPDLQQFLCVINWIRKSIPQYSKTIAPLHSLMKDCYSKAKKRTKRAVRNILLSGLRGGKHYSAFQQIQAHTVQSIQLAYPKPDCRLCLFTDASETHWTFVLTQVHQSQLDVDVEKQDHQPLTFLSESFKMFIQLEYCRKRIFFCGRINDTTWPLNGLGWSLTLHGPFKPRIHIRAIRAKSGNESPYGKQAHALGSQS